MTARSPLQPLVRRRQPQRVRGLDRRWLGTNKRSQNPQPMHAFEHHQLSCTPAELDWQPLRVLEHDRCDWPGTVLPHVDAERIRVPVLVPLQEFLNLRFYPAFLPVSHVVQDVLGLPQQSVESERPRFQPREPAEDTTALVGPLAQDFFGKVGEQRSKAMPEFFACLAASAELFGVRSHGVHVV
jgi:hypothetical protein